MRILIFANGILSPDTDVSGRLGSDDYLIAADGGSEHCRKLGLIPDVIIGDLDSLPPDRVSEWREKGVEILRHPCRKDQTDLELSLDLAQKKGAEEILIFGALGLRWDMTLANIMLLTSPALAGIRVLLVDGPWEVFTIRAEQEVVVRGQSGDILSLVPLSREASGITLRHLAYPLENETLTMGSARGVSNVLTDRPGEIGLGQGLLLAMVRRQVK